MSRLVGMLDSESIYPLLESVSEGEESYGSQTSEAEVFMGGTPLLEPSRGKNAAKPSMAFRGDATVEDPTIREQCEAAERVLHTPSPSDSLDDRALEAAHQETLVECV